MHVKVIGILYTLSPLPTYDRMLLTRYSTLLCQINLLSILTSVISVDKYQKQIQLEYLQVVYLCCAHEDFDKCKGAPYICPRDIKSIGMNNQLPRYFAFIKLALPQVCLHNQNYNTLISMSTIL